MAEVAARYSPLEEALQPDALQCTDVVATFESSLGTTAKDQAANAEEARVRERMTRLRDTMLGLESQQALLERLAGANPAADSEALARLEKEAAEEVARLRESYASSTAECREEAAGVVDLIGTYETKRVELCEQLAALRALVQGSEKPEANPAELEARLEEEVVEIQQANERGMELDDQCAELRSANEKLREQVAALEASQAEAMSAEAAEAQEERLASELSAVSAKLEWVGEIQTVLKGLTGVAVSDFEPNAFVVDIEPEHLRLRLAFNPASATLAEVTVERTDEKEQARGSLGVFKTFLGSRKQQEELVKKHAIDRNDVRFLVRELRECVANTRQFEDELRDLQIAYPVTAVNSELVVTLPQAIVATFQVPREYPKPFAPAQLVSLEAFNGWKASLMAETCAFVTDEQAARPEALASISALLAAVSDRISAVAAEQGAPTL